MCIRADNIKMGLEYVNFEAVDLISVAQVSDQ